MKLFRSQTQKRQRRERKKRKLEAGKKLFAWKMRGVEGAPQ
jgi:hypothetical protein